MAQTPSLPKGVRDFSPVEMYSEMQKAVVFLQNIDTQNFK
jgi:hypothetical protein